MLVCISFAVLCGYAQQNQGEVFPSARTRMWLKEKQVGTSVLHVDYAMNADSIGQEHTYIDLQRLEVGKECAKYYSLFLKRSVGKTHVSGGAIVRGSKSGKNGSFWNDLQYTDLYFKDGQVTEFVSMPMKMERYDSQFTEACPPQEWTLYQETKTIWGYKCQKATCHWRGRDFVAWFAPDIHVKRGPWRFNGLPGLILKVYDTKRLYTFEVVSIKKTEEPIMLYNFGYKTSARKKVRELERAIQENYWKAATTSTQFPDKPFEPLEKE